MDFHQCAFGIIPWINGTQYKEHLSFYTVDIALIQGLQGWPLLLSQSELWKLQHVRPYFCQLTNIRSPNFFLCFLHINCHFSAARSPSVSLSCLTEHSLHEHFDFFSSQSLRIKATGRALRKGDHGHWDHKVSEENSSVGKSCRSVLVWRRLWLLWLTNRCSAFSFWNVRLDPQHRGTKTDTRVMRWTELNQTPW